jgi:hypothetical protein
VSSRAEIGGNLISHFSNLFKSSNPQTENEMMDLFPPVIIEEENVALCSLLAEKEILEALASLGSTKTPGPEVHSTVLQEILESGEV